MADPGEGPGGPGSPYFSTKMRPEGQKKFFGDRPPPLSDGLDPLLLVYRQGGGGGGWQ